MFKNPLVVCTVLVCITAIVITYMVMSPTYNCLESNRPEGPTTLQKVSCLQGNDNS